MSRSIIFVLMYHRHKLLDLTLISSLQLENCAGLACFYWQEYKSIAKNIFTVRQNRTIQAGPCIGDTLHLCPGLVLDSNPGLDVG
jgi:hypothetical protein